MPLSPEFRKHLDQLTIEIAEKLREDLNEEKRKLVWEAQKTNNSAAIPNAHKKAALNAFRKKVEATTSAHLEALQTCSIRVDASTEQEMLGIFRKLTSHAPSLRFPPGVGGIPNAIAVSKAYSLEASRLGTALFREAANRLREAKFKSARNSERIQHVTMPSASQPFLIAAVAGTLAGLRALPRTDQAMLLLRRMAYVFPQVQNVGGFNKHNILLPNDPIGLAAGFPESEKMPVLRQLLGAPWTQLVNDGYLVDLSGSGFFSISDEGVAAAKSAAIPPLLASAETTGAAEREDNPTALISYSWDSDDHKEWVLQFATRLRAKGGVNVILDRWNLLIGGDRTLFMERSIVSSDFVLVICTPTYAAKSAKRVGGVGYEAMIITAELAKCVEKSKFVPILRSGEWESSLPPWLGTKIGVDLRGDPYDEKQYEDLLRRLHEAQLKAPAIGPRPVFSDDSLSGRMSSSAVADTIAGGPDTRQRAPQRNVIAYAFYETTGKDARRARAIIRPANDLGTILRLETSAGEILEGSETQIAQRYLAFDLELRSAGFLRMQTANGSGNAIFNLPI